MNRKLPYTSPSKNMGSFGGAKKYVVVKRVDSIHPKNVFDYHTKESKKMFLTAINIKVITLGYFRTDRQQLRTFLIVLF